MSSYPPQAQHSEGKPVRYRALSRTAVASLVLAVLSVLTPIHWLLGIIPATGIVL